ncbi:hypothetical protein SUGI_0655670 [Cryptomeria japonica]|nr:hypothetical protein SUGI_0655670 [Cryptomeria japonica]
MPVSSTPLKLLNMLVCDLKFDLQHGIDESCNLTVPSNGTPATLSAQTTWGAIWGDILIADLCPQCHFLLPPPHPWSFDDRGLYNIPSQRNFAGHKQEILFCERNSEDHQGHELQQAQRLLPAHNFSVIQPKPPPPDYFSEPFGSLSSDATILAKRSLRQAFQTASSVSN